MTAAVSQEREFERRLGRRLISARRFAELIGAALERGEGFAAGKLGNSERDLLRLALVSQRETDPLRIRAFECAVVAKLLRTSGIFPPDPEFCRRFGEFYAEQVRRLDCVGVDVTQLRATLELLFFHGIEGEVIDYLDQEPDRSTPNDPARCWLPYLRGRRILLVSPFAELLRRRATRETFEVVWAKTGKPWFYPADVGAVEFPYGYSPATGERFPTALDLVEDITARIAEREFDVAIIGAGGLGIPIASFVKRLDRVGISLGGAIQPLFGVRGRRWNEREDWRRDYFNDAWIDLPPEYRPDPAHTFEDYW
jgi:hypothetical protein